MARTKTGLFTASRIQSMTDNRASIVGVTASSVTGSLQHNVTGSYRYDDPGNPLKSTQQLNIDWKQFENHTFFNSAEAKVNMAFERIINGYPFDGTVEELFKFEDSLTGFEKWVLDSLPHYTGFLNFNGSQSIEVTDRAGTLYPQLSRDTTSRSVLDPGFGPFTYEMYVYIPENRGGNTVSDKQVIAQKIKDNNGITLYTEPTPGKEDTHSDIKLLATSGSVSVEGNVSIERQKWTHISACLNRQPGINRIQIFVNGKTDYTSQPFEIFDFGFKEASLTIGTGTNISASGQIEEVQFNNHFSGSIDDFKVLHSGRTEKALDREKNRKIEPRKSLRLHFAFNEPTGTYNRQDVVLDHSGNSLHSKITGFEEAIRVDGGYGVPVLHEDLSRFPVLFPSHPDVVDFNENLMVSASNYDTNNPNMITKLVPDHYLRQAHFSEGFGDQKEIGDVSDNYGYDTDFPGGGKMGSPQIIAALLLIWAKQFDEMKMYLDQFGKVLHADYIEEDTVADTFLPFMAQYFGLELPDMFPNTSLTQFAGKEGQGVDPAMARLSLQQIQNTLWRRVLSDIREIIRAKGTTHAIKTFIRNLGIDPDRIFRFREYGGSRTGRIGGSRQEVKEVMKVLSFSGSLASGATLDTVTTSPQFHSDINTIGERYQNSPLIVSPFLSGTRVESGYPYPKISTSRFMFANSSSYPGGQENIVKSKSHVKFGVSPEPSDGLFTSGSWTFESMYSFGGSHAAGSELPVTQSLARMYVTGTNLSGPDPTQKENAIAIISFSSVPENNSTIELTDAEGTPNTVTFEFADSDPSNANTWINTTDLSLEQTVKLFHDLIESSALEIESTYLGDGKSLRLRMVSGGEPTKTRIVSSGETNHTTTNFQGGFTDSVLGSNFSGAGFHGRTMLTNLVALSGSQDLQTTGSLSLFLRPIPGRDPLVLTLTGTNVFDGDRWNICYGRYRNDQDKYHVSSSYFLQATKATSDTVLQTSRVEKLFDDHENGLMSNDVAITLQSPEDGDQIVIVSDDDTSKTYVFKNEVPANTGDLDGSSVKVCFNGLQTNSQIASELESAILSSNGHQTDAASSATITIPAAAGAGGFSTLKAGLDFNTFKIEDTEGNRQKFTIRTNTDQSTVGIVGIKSDTTVNDIANSFVDAIRNSINIKVTPKITSSDGDDGQQVITVTQDVKGASGNGGIETVPATPVITYSAFSGGVTAKLVVDRVDNTVFISQSSNTSPTTTISHVGGASGRIVTETEKSAVNLNAFSNITNINKYGAFIVVGDLDDEHESGSDKTYGLDGYNLSGNTILNSHLSAMAQTTKFGGNISHMRFWSKGLTETEHLEHAKNIHSVGVEDPAKKFGFAHNETGGFERLILDASMQQEVTGTNAQGSMLITDFSQNEMDLEAYGFESNKQNLYPRDVKYSILSPNFDQSSEDNKVRVRSYKDPVIARRELVEVAPVYQIPAADKVQDDLRFGVEISIAQALNEDIVNIFATFDEIESAIGAPESQFDVGYVGLENIREVYFNRLTDKINLSNFFQFFRWFDNTVGETIHALIPRKTKFMGVNYIIEPHMLERPKFTYNTADMYLGENNRHGLKGEILLRQLVALVRRY